ncbi:hypothetical protein [Bartonella acomydis]|uniref:DUF106 domain-containing protein n=1 Tax=Bartonella acomydis TaxID=686234 RepID=A0ABP9MUG5_9HYPH
MLLFIGSWGLLGLIIIGIVVFMVLIGLPYFFVKRAKLYCKVSEELRKSIKQEKNALQHLQSEKKAMRQQNAALDARARLFSFKQSMLLWPKEFKIICVFSFIIVLLRSAFFTANIAGWKVDESGIITLLLTCLSVCFLFFAPIVGLLCIKLTSKLRKTMQQLEEAMTQRDKALGMQNARGEKNDQ